MTEEELWLYTLCKKNGIIITDTQISALSLFKTLLLEWNQKINLVSRKNEENIWRGHITLSITMLFKIKFLSGAKILDLGTGGGFPGIPLSILLPECTFLLLDSTQKKIAAVQSMINSLSLTNTKTIWGRAEELHNKDGLKNSFDVVVARSVSNLINLFDWGFQFLKSTSQNNTAAYLLNEKIVISKPSLITFKGNEIHEEENFARQRYPKVALYNIPLNFAGSEEFQNLDKQLVIAHQ
ncbi:MAG: 16S rRNA (guanine(527)-N(7))-methyltransferase RsmG [Ignavibacteriales bacterium]|nr:16S rRNA (guanine(527)-N(7))-methyltransferase RsmG [Ignavibacteriales bacterium]